MAEFFASGQAIDVISFLILLEAGFLLLLRIRYGRGPSPLESMANLASGAMIMLAVRSALTGGSWQIIAGLLMASFAAHITDRVLRFRSTG